MPEIKRVTLHPLSGEGLVDIDVNLYPKTLINGVVDESGNEVEIVKRSDFDEAVNAIETEIDTKENILNTKIDVLEETKQAKLVSGENIKTINDIPLIGEGNITLTKNSVGLYYVDNTADLDKPISTATQAALDEKQDVISDLDTIRTGALAGATAVQPAALEASLSTKQDTLVSGENIKTVNGTSVLGSGDIVISTNSSFHSGWNVSGTTAEFYDSIIADTTVKAGDSFLGTLCCSDLPAGMIQAEAIVSIISRGANNAVDIALTSVEVSPYRWNYSRAWVNGSYITTGWIGLQAEITNNNKLAASKISGLASVATSGDYDDLLNKPVIPVVNYPVTDVQVGGTSVLNGTVAEIPALFDGDYTSLTNKPDLSVYALSTSLATVATSGSYNDLEDKPVIPEVPTNVSAFTNDAGYLTSNITIEIDSNDYDYIYDEASWNAAYNRELGGLRRYYNKYPDEDRWVFVDMQHLRDNDPTGGHYGRASDKNPDGTWPENAIQCWWGCVNASGVKLPWIVPFFNSDVNAKIRFEYDGKESVYPWGTNCFGIRRKADGSDRLWGVASVAEEFQDNAFLIEENKNNGSQEWAHYGEFGQFDLTKFKMILVKQGIKII